MRIAFRDIHASEPRARPYGIRGDSVYGRAAVSVYATRWLAHAFFKMTIRFCTTYLRLLLCLCGELTCAKLAFKICPPIKTLAGCRTVAKAVEFLQMPTICQGRLGDSPNFDSVLTRRAIRRIAPTVLFQPQWIHPQGCFEGLARSCSGRLTANMDRRVCMPPPARPSA